MTSFSLVAALVFLPLPLAGVFRPPLAAWNAPGWVSHFPTAEHLVYLETEISRNNLSQTMIMHFSFILRYFKTFNIFNNRKSKKTIIEWKSSTYVIRSEKMTNHRANNSRDVFPWPHQIMCIKTLKHIR